MADTHPLESRNIDVLYQEPEFRCSTNYIFKKFYRTVEEYTTARISYLDSLLALHCSISEQVIIR
jgi:hypothetical protein